ncbi:MAG TPA: ABC transporter ATP-binding protein [Candidatus Pacearchaeota archaeon]|nr:ABC transporter ATP-binding protein [Candidatus Pacearchaeota archaeon]
MEDLIKIENLCKSYQGEGCLTPVLKEINFSIAKGEFVAIMGPSGSGKSTLLHMLGFLDTQSAGKYYFEGKTMDDYGQEKIAHIRNHKMGFVFQSFNLLNKTSVLDNVKLPLLYSGISEDKWDKLAIDAIAKVKMEHRIDHTPGQLSGGEQQRVAIARALVMNPEVIFADEPTGNLDSKSGQIIMEILQDLNDAGETIVLITHEKSTAMHAKRIIHILDGQIDSDTKLEQQLKAKDSYTK